MLVAEVQSAHQGMAIVVHHVCDRLARRHGRMSHFTVNYKDMSDLATLLARGAQAMSFITKMSSQLYMPHYLVIRSEASCVNTV